MPEMLPANKVNYVAVPAQQQPVAAGPKAPTPQAAPAPRPEAPPDPFELRPGPALMIIPHEEAPTPAPVQQRRPQAPVRFAENQPLESPLQALLRQVIEHRRVHGGDYRETIHKGGKGTDTAIHHIFADQLTDLGDERAAIVRGHFAQRMVAVLKKHDGDYHWLTVGGPNGGRLQPRDERGGYPRHHALVFFGEHGGSNYASVPMAQLRGFLGEVQRHPANLESNYNHRRQMLSEEIRQHQRADAPAPERMHRRPVKNTASPQDMAALYHALLDNPKDQARWHILADALREQGHDMAADIIARHVKQPNTDWKDLQDRRDPSQKVVFTTRIGSPTFKNLRPWLRVVSGAGGTPRRLYHTVSIGVPSEHGPALAAHFHTVDHDYIDRLMTSFPKGEASYGSDLSRGLIREMIHDERHDPLM